MQSRILKYLALAVPAMLVLSGTAHAAGILDSVTNNFRSLEPVWFNRLYGDARDLFSILIVIEIAWFALTSVLAGRGFEEIVPGFVKKVMTIGFFYAILINAGAWTTDIMNSFEQAGSAAGGISALSPSTIVSYGIADALRILTGGQATLAHNSGGWFAFLNIGSDIGRMAAFFVELVERVILAAMIFVAFFVIALDMLILLIESYLILGAGVLFLGFGGSRWTARYVNSYFNYAISVAVKLFVIYLIVGALYTTVIPEINTQLNNVSTHLNIGAVLTTAVTAMAAALLAKKIPEHAGALLGGSANLTAGLFGSEVARATMIAGTAAAAVATGGAAAVAGTTTAAASGAAGAAGAAGVTGAAGAGGVAASSGAAGVAAPSTASSAAGAAGVGGVAAPASPSAASGAASATAQGGVPASPGAGGGASGAAAPSAASSSSAPPSPSAASTSARSSASTPAASGASGSASTSAGSETLPENAPMPSPSQPAVSSSGQAAGPSPSAPGQAPSRMSMSERFAKNIRAAQGVSSFAGKLAGGHGSTSGVSANHANFGHGNDV